MQDNDTKCFPHERLHAYQRGQDMISLCEKLTAKMPRGFSDLRDQARRSALSTVRHIAEGASRVSAADRRARYVIARGEVAELHATISSAVSCGALQAQRVQELLALTQRISAMLCGLIRRENERQSRHMIRKAPSRTATRAKPR